jgi:hypothetical protein
MTFKDFNVTAYAIFCAGTALVGLPAILICIYLDRATRQPAAGVEVPVSSSLPAA